MTKTYSPNELAKFVWDVNESLLAMHENRPADMADPLTIANGITEAFRQAYVELFMLKSIDADDWFSESDPVRKHWSSAIKSAKARYDAIEESDKSDLKEQEYAQESPVMAALQAIAAGIQAMNSKMDQMISKEPAETTEEKDSPAEETPPPAEAEEPPVEA